MTIGQNIKHLREQRGYSQQELATLAGTDKRYISFIEQDKRKGVSLRMLEKIAEVLRAKVVILSNHSKVFRKQNNDH